MKFLDKISKHIRKNQMKDNRASIRLQMLNQKREAQGLAPVTSLESVETKQMEMITEFKNSINPIFSYMYPGLFEHEHDENCKDCGIIDLKEKQLANKKR